MCYLHRKQKFKMVNEITSPNGMCFEQSRVSAIHFTNDCLHDVSVRIMWSTAVHGWENFHMFKNVPLQGQPQLLISNQIRCFGHVALALMSHELLVCFQLACFGLPLNIEPEFESLDNERSSHSCSGDRCRRSDRLFTIVPDSIRRDVRPSSACDPSPA